MKDIINKINKLVIHQYIRHHFLNLDKVFFGSLNRMKVTLNWFKQRAKVSFTCFIKNRFIL